MIAQASMDGIRCERGRKIGIGRREFELVVSMCGDEEGDMDL